MPDEDRIVLSDPEGFEWDLHSYYASIVGYWDNNSVQWFDRSFSYLFESFENFLSFGWPSLVVIDKYSGRAHVAIKAGSVGAFAKMMKTRFSFTLPKISNQLPLSPVPRSPQPVRIITSLQMYRQVCATFPAQEFAALKARIRSGREGVWLEKWWADRGRGGAVASVSFVTWEKNPTIVLECGTASLRCGHLDAANKWPPVPGENYRKSHVLLSPYHDKPNLNTKTPNKPRNYAFSQSMVCDADGLQKYLNATIASISSLDHDSIPNHLILVGHSMEETLKRISEQKHVTLPSNTIIVDTAIFERSLFRGYVLRSQGIDAGTASNATNSRAARSLEALHKSQLGRRDPNSIIDLRTLLRALGVEVEAELGNAGNDAYYQLVAFHLLMDPKAPKPTPRYSPPSPTPYATPFPVSPGEYLQHPLHSHTNGTSSHQPLNASYNSSNGNLPPPKRSSLPPSASSSSSSPMNNSHKQLPDEISDRRRQSLLSSQQPPAIIQRSSSQGPTMSAPLPTQKRFPPENISPESESLPTAPSRRQSDSPHRVNSLHANESPPPSAFQMNSSNHKSATAIRFAVEDADEDDEKVPARPERAKAPRRLSDSTGGGLKGGLRGKPSATRRLSSLLG